jgi:septum formation protein
VRCLVLASASPRRADLMRRVGLDPIVDPAHIDEVVPPDVSLDRAAALLAEQKASAIAERHDAGTVVVGADTVVELDGEALGKPIDAIHATAMLTRLAGRTHQVHTGVCVVTVGGSSSSGVATTAVTMRPLSAAEIEAYVATGEGGDAAGSYAIQGRAGGFVTSIDGDHSTVVGLPLTLLTELLHRAGISVASPGGPGS